MPEITTAEAVRSKLREFDERMEGAIAAAKILSQVKRDAEQIISGIHSISSKSTEALREVETIRGNLQEIQQQWSGLKQQVQTSVSESKASQDLVLSELDSAVRLISDKLTLAEENLKIATKKSLDEQGLLLTRLEASTKDHAKAAEGARASAVERAEKIGQMLRAVETDLQSRISTRLNQTEELLTSRVDNVEKALHGQLESFKGEMGRDLAEHEKVMDRQITEFLNKQNALVQNLSQHIDSMQRAMQVLTSEVSQTKTDLGELATAFRRHQAATTDELTSLRTDLANVRASVMTLQSDFQALREQLKARRLFTGVR